ncbi:hypothetical protein G7Y89_g1326 [Cudoniella acicularis]|uniref:Uncharacterized protein n=1 Tax=Cudoniella acicularis TaxID=354080 RepID=A0A8H4W750_9HELO|nr:hypothetical protein G7Y89_g1326 [Cudoniella acicularis]
MSLILTKFGTFDSFLQVESTVSDLKACTYLQFVISEALRLQPAIPINSRTALCSTTLPRGGGADGQSPIYLRKGQEVTYFVYALHRDPTIWSEDAEKFRPERWEGRTKGWEYLPFNGARGYVLNDVERHVTLWLRRANDEVSRVFDHCHKPQASQHNNILKFLSFSGPTVNIQFHNANQKLELLYLDAVVPIDNVSTAQCWELDPYIVSDTLGIVGTASLNLGNVSNVQLNYFPSAMHSPKHNAPAYQIVVVLQGRETMTMDSNETIFAETGSMFIGADPVGTSSGHASDWSPNTAILSIPFSNGQVPKHNVVSRDMCPSNRQYEHIHAA